MPAYGKRRRGKQALRSSVTLSSSAVEGVAASRSAGEAKDPSTSLTFGEVASQQHHNTDLILTSEKRRGVYECDYCRADISQLPRIRCAVCPDFDLCLDCFVTTDHSSAIARLKAAANVQDALKEDGAIVSTGITSAAFKHDESHGYRVCDSTRFPLFPAARHITPVLSSKGSILNDSASESQSDIVKADEKEVEVNEAQAESLTAEGEKKPNVSETDVFSDKAMTEGSELLDKFTKGPAGEPNNSNTDVASADVTVVHGEDPRNIWTAEEDLRLLEGIRAHGLGNWVDISETVSGQGSIGKTPKKCMERYLDDFLGRYGYILPPYTLVPEEDDKDDSQKAASEPIRVEEEEETIRSSKRRSALLRSPTSAVNMSLTSRKKFKAVPTESLPEYKQLWPHMFLPKVDGVQAGQDVGREQAYKAELAFVRAISSVASTEEEEKIRIEWAATKLNQPGGPTVLPMRIEDLPSLPGAELAGFMPRRGDFDVEWENEAEQTIADMEFLPGESAQDKMIKLQVLAIYNTKLDGREQRKKFILSRNLFDYRKHQEEDQKLPRDERDLVHRMRMFERFHTPEEHKLFLAGLLKAKRLRKEIAKLQMYRRMGIKSLTEAEKYELDKARRQFHKSTTQQREAEAKRAETGSTTAGDPSSRLSSADQSSFSLWKQYRTTDRRVRKSINRGESAETLNKGESNEPEAKTTEEEGALSEKKIEDPLDGEEQQEHPPTKADMQEADLARAEVSASLPDNKATAARDEMEGLPGFKQLSAREIDLCRRLQLLPAQYIEIKKALLLESLSEGLLDNDPMGESTRKVIFQMDVERRGQVVDFLLRAGWIKNNPVKSS